MADYDPFGSLHNTSGFIPCVRYTSDKNENISAWWLPKDCGVFVLGSWRLSPRLMHQFAIRLRFSTPPNDRNTLPKTIFDRLPHQPGLETREFKPPSGALGRIRKDHRTGLIRVDWVDMSSYQEKQKFAKDTSRGVANRLALIVALTLTQVLQLLASKKLHQKPLLVQ